MAKARMPERVQAQRLVTNLAEQLASVFTEQSAKAILTLQVDAPPAERREELADKANEGTLTPEEFADYETYAQLRGFLSLLQSKARRFLADAGRA
jgi:hypothetical protein